MKIRYKIIAYFYKNNLEYQQAISKDEILRSIQEANEKGLPSHILFHSNLSETLIENYKSYLIQILIEDKMIERQGASYIITEKGRHKISSSGYLSDFISHKITTVVVVWVFGIAATLAAITQFILNIIQILDNCCCCCCCN